jgi:hypothetical protein
MSFPPSNVNPSYANVYGSNYAEYNSTDNSRAYGLSGQISNIAAANASKGGGRRKRRRKSRTRKSRTRKSRSRKSRSRKSRSISYKGGGCPSCQVGGLSSVTNINHGYSVGPPVQLTWNQSALANPGPYTENLAPGQTLNVI